MSFLLLVVILILSKSFINRVATTSDDLWVTKAVFSLWNLPLQVAAAAAVGRGVVIDSVGANDCICTGGKGNVRQQGDLYVVLGISTFWSVSIGECADSVHSSCSALVAVFLVWWLLLFECEYVGFVIPWMLVVVSGACVTAVEDISLLMLAIASLFVREYASLSTTSCNCKFSRIPTFEA